MFEVCIVYIPSGRGIPCGKALSEMSGRVIDGSFQFPELMHSSVIVGRDPVLFSCFRDDIDRSGESAGPEYTGRRAGYHLDALYVREIHREVKTLMASLWVGEVDPV